MLVGMLLMFLLIAAVEGCLAWFVWLRLGDHLKGNHEAVEALSRHLLVPLLGKNEPAEKQPE